MTILTPPVGKSLPSGLGGRQAKSPAGKSRWCGASAWLPLCVALLGVSLGAGCEEPGDPFRSSTLFDVDTSAGDPPSSDASGELGALDVDDGGESSAFDAGVGSSGDDAALDAEAEVGPDRDAAGAADASGQAGDAARDAGDDAAPGDFGRGDGSDVLMIGDSWMTLGDSELGVQRGILRASAQPYRAAAVGGSTLLASGTELVTPIPAQYAAAVQADPDVRTVIMTGGGDDIVQAGLLEDCKMGGTACDAHVAQILDGLSLLWSEMARDGVRDVVYVLYATPEGASVDFALPDGDDARNRCALVLAPMRCHVVETLDIVMGDFRDEVHPSQAASDRIGEAVVELMRARGMRR